MTRLLYGGGKALAGLLPAGLRCHQCCVRAAAVLPHTPSPAVRAVHVGAPHAECPRAPDLTLSGRHARFTQSAM